MNKIVMKSAIKKQLLIFIATELLNLSLSKTPSKESRNNNKGQRTSIIAEDKNQNKYCLLLSIINSSNNGVLISVDTQDIKWPERSDIKPEHFDFLISNNKVEHGQLTKHRLVSYLPVLLPKELFNKICS